MHFRKLFKLDLIDQFNAAELELQPSKGELYAEFEEYSVDKAPAEEYELVKHWSEDLKLDNLYELVPGSVLQKKNYRFST